MNILLARGFSFRGHGKGDHDTYSGQWAGRKRIVTVDMGIGNYNDPAMIKMILRESGMTREEFYGATKKTAKKINLRMAY